MEKNLGRIPHHFWQNLFLCWALLFVVLFPLSFPFERGGILPDPGAYTQGFFEQLARFTGDYLFRLRPGYSSLLVSDTMGFYLNAFNCLLLSLLGAFAWMKIFRNNHRQEVLVFALVIFVRYYLALQMFWYGFDKIFKVQFYLPEPNTLFTPMGQVPKDLLYWSAMGSSYTYTVFAGITELLAAVLLLFHRTYLLGVLITTGIMVNVLMINIGFDVSVKLYSCFLLLLCAIIISLHARSLYRFFILHLPVAQKHWRPVLDSVKKKNIYRVTKMVVVVLLLSDALAPFIRAGNYNDDRFPRPFLHGAYEVETFERNGKKQEACMQNPQRWKRFFVHRRGYFIVQNMQEEMGDFALQYDVPQHRLILQTYDSTNIYFNYHFQKDHLELEGIVNRDTLKITGKKIRLDQLPLLKNEFSWTIDEPVK